MAPKATAGEVGPSKRSKRSVKPSQPTQQHAGTEEWNMVDVDDDDLDEDDDNFLVCTFTHQL